MIRVVCSSCQSEFDARGRYSGRTTNCPNCGAEIHITNSGTSPEALTLADAVPEQHVHVVDDKRLPSAHVPQRLSHQNLYLICDESHLVAKWEDNGQGWMLATNSGFTPALRNQELLPAQGDFMLVELILKKTSKGLRLGGITSYQLARRWAMTELDQGNDKILSRIAGDGFLNKQQKALVRKAIADQLMWPVWKDSKPVLDYLANTDYHSPGING